jgi:hypothetical protein
MDALDPSSPRFTVFDEPAAAAPYDRDPSGKPVASRGVIWVLRWAGALATLLVSIVTLIEFAYDLSAEQTVARAARAAALEATLPRATMNSVAETVRRRLGRLAERSEDWNLSVLQNDLPVGAIVRPREGDFFSVTVAAANRAHLPWWLRRLTFWKDGSLIEVRARQRMPGRGLP